ncbi:MAG: dockerin type I domain-containing protein [Patescibacteria group bacterium]
MFFVIFFIYHEAYGAALMSVSDTISDSRPGIGINHTLQFTPSSTIPVNGKILVIPQAGAFTIPSGMDRSEVDVVIDGVEKMVAATPGVGTDIVVTMSSGTSGVITMVPKSGPINAGSVVTVEIGTNATYIDLGAYQIQSPGVTGSYAVDIETKNTSNVRLDASTAMIFILQGVSMTGYVGAAPSSTPEPTPTPTTTPSSGGGGGGGVVETVSAIGQVSFCGKGYPLRTVTLLKDTQVSASTTVDVNDDFKLNLSGLKGSYFFGLYETDKNDLRSPLVTLTTNINQGEAVVTQCIVMPPTVDISNFKIKKGDPLIISGYALSNADVGITIGKGVVDAPNKRVVHAISGQDGRYRYILDTNTLERDVTYAIVSKVTKGMFVSPPSFVLKFRVGDKTIPKEELGGCKRHDLNCDGYINLVDFSILAYWYKRPLTEVAQKKVDFNDDKKVDLRDFSILAFHWTG